MDLFAKKAHPYQRKALRFCLINPCSYLQLDMGLGKTVISLKWLEDKIDKGVLIIAPLRAISTTWPEEIEKWGFSYSYTILHGSNKLHNLGKKVQLYIINFEGIPWLFKELKTLFKITNKLPFRTVIIDEGSMIKSPHTKRFKALKNLTSVFHNKLILSGTPSPNSLLDLWSQYFFLDNGERLETAFYKYKQQYFYPIDYKQFKWVIKSQQEKEVIYDKIKDITFRLDAGDYIKLPDKISNVVKLNLPEKIKENYNSLEKKFFLALDEVDVEVFNSAALSMKLRQYIQGGLYTDDKGSWELIHKVKLNKLQEMVEIADGNGILCPIQFKFELEIIRSVFPKVPAIVGGVSAKETTKYIKAWNRKEMPLLLCHPASLSHAVNMQNGGTIIIWYGLPWSSEQYQQLNARLHRQGQTRKVYIHHLVMRDTVDVAIMKALKAKIKGQNNLLDFIRDYHNE